MSLFDAELYSAAVVVHQLIGNLVYFSNHGRYEPRLAESWVQPDTHTWKFKLRDGLFCQNGEAITAQSFRDSLLRSIRIQQNKGGALVFNQLKGFDSFANGGAALAGLQAEGPFLSFSFANPVKDGLLEALSYAPFGYICRDNYKADGTWQAETSFISSGPYQAESVEIGKLITIRKRPGWVLPFAESAPELVRVSYVVPEVASDKENWIVDVTRKIPEGMPAGLVRYKMVPEYMSAVILGNLEHGFFSRRENRASFKVLIERQRQRIPKEQDLRIRASSFYPSQEFGQSTVPEESAAKVHFSRQTKPLRIQGKAPPAVANEYYAKNYVEAALKEAGLTFEYDHGDQSQDNLSDESFDIRSFAQAIGGEVRPWTLKVLFCSALTYRYPDPSGRVCRLIEEFDAGKVSREDVTKKFFQYVDEDAAVFPLIHYGINLFLSPSIDTESFAPTLSVMRFDQLKMK